MSVYLICIHEGLLLFLVRSDLFLCRLSSLSTQSIVLYHVTSMTPGINLVMIWSAYERWSKANNEQKSGEKRREENGRVGICFDYMSTSQSRRFYGLFSIITRTSLITYNIPFRCAYVRRGNMIGENELKSGELFIIDLSNIFFGQVSVCVCTVVWLKSRPWDNDNDDDQRSNRVWERKIVTKERW